MTAAGNDHGKDPHQGEGKNWTPDPAIVVEPTVGRLYRPHFNPCRSRSWVGREPKYAARSAMS